MNITTLLNAMPGACAQGLIWGIMAIGVYITYKILDLADLTVDGTMCTGGAVCIMMRFPAPLCPVACRRQKRLLRKSHLTDPGGMFRVPWPDVLWQGA